MLIEIPQVLAKEQVEEFVGELYSAQWADGRGSAGYLSSAVKSNAQLADGDPTSARLGKAVVIPFVPRRLPQGGYSLDILPPLAEIPSGDAARDTLQYHEVLEEYIRLCPEQYYWIHRNFKNRPAPLPDAYADLDASK